MAMERPEYEEGQQQTQKQQEQIEQKNEQQNEHDENDKNEGKKELKKLTLSELSQLIINLNLQSPTQIKEKEKFNAEIHTSFQFPAGNLENSDLLPISPQPYKPPALSLIGSYEESLLRGRMSTPPSRPIEFVCQVGVVSQAANGKRKCPPHILIPFKASFYEWTKQSSSRVSTPPPTRSPIGQKNKSAKGSSRLSFISFSESNEVFDNRQDEVQSTKPMIRQRSISDAAFYRPNDIMKKNMNSGSHSTPSTPIESPVQQILNKRRNSTGAYTPLFQSQSLLSPSSSSAAALITPSEHVTEEIGTPYVGTISLPQEMYRIPSRGQLQVLIKNPNRTVVKIFLVPYDLRKLGPGEKTILRQKSIYEGCSPNKNNSTSRQLLYAIHLQFKCTVDQNQKDAKKKWWLYKSIRVVFSHRLPPDMKQKDLKVIYESPLFQQQVTTQLPESTKEEMEENEEEK